MQYSLGTPLPGVLFSKRHLWNRHHWQRGEEAVQAQLGYPTGVAVDGAGNRMGGP